MVHIMYHSSAKKSCKYIFICSTLVYFHLPGPSLGMFAQGKEVDASGKKTAGNVQSICCWEVGLAEVGNNLNGRWQFLPGKKSVKKKCVCAPNFFSLLFTSAAPFS